MYLRISRVRDMMPQFKMAGRVLLMSEFTSSSCDLVSCNNTVCVWRIDCMDFNVLLTVFLLTTDPGSFTVNLLCYNL